MRGGARDAWRGTCGTCGTCVKRGDVLIDRLPSLSAPTPAPAQRATILVVDDSAENLTLMHGLLKDTYRVLAASSGEKALQIARAASPPDLILLDIMMPGMDGYEICGRLGADPSTASIPVIFLTARTEEEDEQRGLEVGAVDYISKPVSAPIVLARVRNHLALKAMADAMREKNGELELARSVAEEANRAKSEFLSRMSHELRSPLNAIIGFAQLMESELPTPTASQQLSIAQILKGGWYLLELIDEILDLAVIESGQLLPQMEMVSLDELLPECADLVADSARKHEVTVLMPSASPSVVLHADRKRLKQVLLNLLSNAIKYNRRGGSVRLGCAPIDDGRVRLSVTDTGEGLSPAKLSQLFESFNRLGQESGGEQGTGIGLVVSKRLTEMMGGRIGAESAVGVGSTFWIELESGTGAGTGAGADTGVGTGVATARPTRTVLYVEDNPANLRLVEQLIRRRPDLQLLSAGDANYGIEIAISAHPALILMDINLPGISGIGMLRLLRADRATRDIPVVALTANSAPHEIARGIEAGFLRYLTKPLRIPEFLGMLDEVLGAVSSPTS